jgi:nitrate reductase NapE component
MNRPPPYFPQSQLSPPDPNRYKKFKRTVAFIAVGLVLLLIGAGVGIYYLIQWMLK